VIQFLGFLSHIWSWHVYLLNLEKIFMTKQEVKMISIDKTEICIEQYFFTIVGFDFSSSFLAVVLITVFMMLIIRLLYIIR